jgi:hypothetical protein
MKNGRASKNDRVIGALVVVKGVVAKVAATIVGRKKPPSTLP